MSLNQRMDVEELHNPNLTPREQALIVTNFWQKQFANFSHTAVMLSGGVFTTDRIVRNSPNVTYRSDLLCFSFYRHYYTQVTINGIDIIIDYSLQRVIDQYHESIPFGAFTQDQFPKFHYITDRAIEISETIYAPTYEKLRTHGL